jgi:hypothetical protein
MDFSVPLFSEGYLTSGAYFYIMPWALPFAQIGSTGFQVLKTVPIKLECFTINDYTVGPRYMREIGTPKIDSHITRAACTIKRKTVQLF